MGKLTPEMIRKIRESYSMTPSYKGVSDKLRRESGMQVDERTVRKYVRSSYQTRTVLEKDASKSLVMVAGARKADKDSKTIKRTLRMFEHGKTPLQVATSLGIDPPKVAKLWTGYLNLAGLDTAYKAYEKYGQKIFEVKETLDLGIEIASRKNKLSELDTQIGIKTTELAPLDEKLVELHEIQKTIEKLVEDEQTQILVNKELRKRSAAILEMNGRGLEPIKQLLRDEAMKMLKDETHEEIFKQVASSLVEKLTTDPAFEGAFSKYLKADAQERKVLELNLKKLIDDARSKIVLDLAVKAIERYLLEKRAKKQQSTQAQVPSKLVTITQ